MTQPVFRGPGERLYEAHRAAHNSKNGRVADAGRLPRWKNLKPKTMKLWNETAIIYEKERHGILN